MNTQSRVTLSTGDPEQTAAEGTNVFGQENSVYPVLETYQEGSVIEMKVVISTYHWVSLERIAATMRNLRLAPESKPIVYRTTPSCETIDSSSNPPPFPPLTHPQGHFEFHICNSENLSDPDGPVTQGCFNMHPLDRAEDDGDARQAVVPSCRKSTYFR